VVVTGTGRSTGLLDLAARLVGEVGRFVDQRLELFKAELKQEATDVAKSLGRLAAGALGASAGAVLLLLALGLWVGDLVGSRPGGLAIVGGGLALGGGVLVLLTARSLGQRRLVPGTFGELRKDAEWIRHEV
jgi:putative superfamily III holin-X